MGERRDVKKYHVGHCCSHNGKDPYASRRGKIQARYIDPLQEKDPVSRCNILSYVNVCVYVRSCVLQIRILIFVEFIPMRYVIKSDIIAVIDHNKLH
jgi:hypothetical protein